MTGTKIAEQIREGVAAGVAAGLERADLGPTPTPNERHATAVHEAGHGAAAVLLGLECHGLALRPHCTDNEINLGEAETTSAPAAVAARVVRSSESLALAFAADAAACLAGPLAEAMAFDADVKFHGTDRPAFDAALRNFTSATDPLLRGLQRMKDHAVLRERLDGMLRRLLHEERHAVTAVAEALEQSGRLDGTEVKALVAAHRTTKGACWVARLARAVGIPLVVKVPGLSPVAKSTRLARDADPFDTPQWRAWAKRYVAGGA